MPTVIILAVGLLVVVGGILVLRLHAFVALVLAALLVAALTSPTAIIRSQLIAAAHELHVVPPEEFTFEELAPGDGASGDSLLNSGPRRIAVRTDRWLDENTLWTRLPEPGLPFTAAAVMQWKLVPMDSPEPFLYELVPAGDGIAGEVGTDQAAAFLHDLAQRGSLQVVPTKELQLAVPLSGSSPIDRVTSALGSAAGKLAILIVAASIIGACLLQSGAADRVVQSFLNAVGEKASPVAFTAGGFILAIPVFFDTVFLLMIPLAKSLYQRTRRNYLLSVLAIVVGGTMAHSLVPPTPGPLLIADQFQVSMPSMIVGGMVVGCFAAGCGLLFAVWVNRHWELIPPEFQATAAASAGGAPGTVVPSPSASGSSVARLQSAPSESAGGQSGPALFESLLPVVLPVLLMVLGTALHQTQDVWYLGSIPLPPIPGLVLQAVTERNLALILGAVLAVITLLRFQNVSPEELGKTIQAAVTSAGAIILVTAAGAAFGKMMEQTAVAELLQQIPAASPVAIVVAAFLVTTAVRTAQGSATVAMMTAAGVFGGLVTSGAAGVAPLYAALAVGCGSKPFSWMNDSGFLVITRMSGMNDNQGLRFVTTVMAIAGFAGLLAVIVGVVFLPDLPR